MVSVEGGVHTGEGSTLVALKVWFWVWVRVLVAEVGVKECRAKGRQCFESRVSVKGRRCGSAEGEAHAKCGAGRTKAWSE